MNRTEEPKRGKEDEQNNYAKPNIIVQGATPSAGVWPAPPLADDYPTYVDQTARIIFVVVVFDAHRRSSPGVFLVDGQNGISY